ncbi:hypothetical protein GF345_05490 [Candidatus Woesearchaeota archaeon]|nr:hypothetical protein [Candidatus Woesearchaeota archaeon]
MENQDGKPQAMCSYGIHSGQPHAVRPEGNMVYHRPGSVIVCGQGECADQWAAEYGPPSKGQIGTASFTAIEEIIAQTINQAFISKAIRFDGNSQGYMNCDYCGEQVREGDEGIIGVDSKGRVYCSIDSNGKSCVMSRHMPEHKVPRIIVRASIDEIMKYAGPFRENAGKHAQEEIFARP